MAIGIVPATPSLMRMEGNGEGNYASAASPYCEHQNTDQGLTLSPKIQSPDAQEVRPHATSSRSFEDLSASTLNVEDLDALFGRPWQGLVGRETSNDGSWEHTLKTQEQHQLLGLSNKRTKLTEDSVLKLAIVKSTGKEALKSPAEDATVPKPVPEPLVKDNAVQHLAGMSNCEDQSRGFHHEGDFSSLPGELEQARRSRSESLDITPGGCIDQPRGHVNVNGDDVQFARADDDNSGYPNHSRSRESCDHSSAKHHTHGRNEHHASTNSTRISSPVRKGEGEGAGDGPAYLLRDPDSPVPSIEVEWGVGGRVGGNSGLLARETAPRELKSRISSGHQRQQSLPSAEFEHSLSQTGHPRNLVANPEDDYSVHSSASPYSVLLPIAAALEKPSRQLSLVQSIIETKLFLQSVDSQPAHKLLSPPEIDRTLFPGFDKLEQTFKNNHKFRSSAVSWVLGKMEEHDSGKKLGPESNETDEQWIDSLSPEQLRETVKHLWKDKAKHDRTAIALQRTQNKLEKTIIERDDAIKRASTSITRAQAQQQMLDNSRAANSRAASGKPMRVPDRALRLNEYWECGRILDTGEVCGAINTATVRDRSNLGNHLPRTRCIECKMVPAEEEKNYRRAEPDEIRRLSSRSTRSRSNSKADAGQPDVASGTKRKLHKSGYDMQAPSGEMRTDFGRDYEDGAGQYVMHTEAASMSGPNRWHDNSAQQFLGLNEQFVPNRGFSQHTPGYSLSTSLFEANGSGQSVPVNHDPSSQPIYGDLLGTSRGSGINQSMPLNRVSSQTTYGNPLSTSLSGASGSFAPRKRSMTSLQRGSSRQALSSQQSRPSPIIRTAAIGALTLPSTSTQQPHHHAAQINSPKSDSQSPYDNRNPDSENATRAAKRSKTTNGQSLPTAEEIASANRIENSQFHNMRFASMAPPQSTELSARSQESQEPLPDGNDADSLFGDEVEDAERSGL